MEEEGEEGKRRVRSEVVCGETGVVEHTHTSEEFFLNSLLSSMSFFLEVSESSCFLAISVACLSNSLCGEERQERVVICYGRGEVSIYLKVLYGKLPPKRESRLDSHPIYCLSIRSVGAALLFLLEKLCS